MASEIKQIAGLKFKIYALKTIISLTKWMHTYGGKITSIVLVGISSGFAIFSATFLLIWADFFRERPEGYIPNPDQGAIMLIAFMLLALHPYMWVQELAIQRINCGLIALGFIQFAGICYLFVVGVIGIDTGVFIRGIGLISAFILVQCFFMWLEGKIVRFFERRKAAKQALPEGSIDHGA